jgi:hypothetical protein
VNAAAPDPPKFQRGDPVVVTRYERRGRPAAGAVRVSASAVVVKCEGNVVLVQYADGRVDWTRRKFLQAPPGGQE